jgi:hypothetical protein
MSPLSPLSVSIEAWDFFFPTSIQTMQHRAHVKSVVTALHENLKYQPADPMSCPLRYKFKPPPTSTVLIIAFSKQLKPATCHKKHATISHGKVPSFENGSESEHVLVFSALACYFASTSPRHRKRQRLKIKFTRFHGRLFSSKTS